MLEEEPRAPYEDYKALMAHDARLHELILRMAGNEAVRVRTDQLPSALLPPLAHSADG